MDLMHINLLLIINIGTTTVLGPFEQKKPSIASGLLWDILFRILLILQY